MIGNILYRILLIMIVFALGTHAYAQEFGEAARTVDNTTRFLGGATVAGTLNQYSRGIPMAFQAICSVLEDGVGTGFAGGLTMEYLLNRELSIASHIRFGTHPGHFERIEPIGRTNAFANETGGSSPVIITILSDINYQLLEGDVLLKWSPMRFGPRNAVGFAIGPSIGYVLEGTMKQDQRIQIFYNNQLLREDDIIEQASVERKRNLTEGGEDIETLRPLRLAMRGGVFVNYEIHPSITLVPGLYMDYSLNTFTERRYGNLDLTHFQCDLLIAL